ncbi:MAG: nucleotide-binding protein [Streptococcaceae bacterium]|jgi:predicted nucleotide-binding protein|nr:nucleotide-binding protein [Streptococcaceae bacterium]
MTTEEVKAILSKNGLNIQTENRIGNDTGDCIHLEDGAIVNIFDSGKVNVQGKNAESIKSLFNEVNSALKSENRNRKVFVVYGHDNNNRTQLEAMLRRWNLEPLILDQLTSSGQTIIEKLEDYIDQASFGIVLATPDDCGYSKGNEDKVKYRVRQNVVLELGILLAKLGRSKVAILLSQAEDMEHPSDISGLVYIPFKENVEEAKVSLAKEMEKWGYTFTATML